MNIMNLCIKECTFLDKFKLAIVKPIYKTGNRENVNNYRPISMKSNFSKIFEKIFKQD